MVDITQKYTDLVDEAAGMVPGLIKALDDCKMSPEAMAVGLVRFGILIAKKGGWDSVVCSALTMSIITEMYGNQGMDDMKTVISKIETMAAQIQKSTEKGGSN